MCCIHYSFDRTFTVSISCGKQCYVKHDSEFRSIFCASVSVGRNAVMDFLENILVRKRIGQHEQNRAITSRAVFLEERNLPGKVHVVFSLTSLKEQNTATTYISNILVYKLKCAPQHLKITGIPEVLPQLPRERFCKPGNLWPQATKQLLKIPEILSAILFIRLDASAREWVCEGAFWPTCCTCSSLRVW